MNVVLRSGDFKFEALDTWGQLPDGLRLIECPGVAVNSKDEVHVLTRNKNSEVLVFGSDGTFRRSFGLGVFSDFSHGIYVGSDDSIYCADVGTHTITKFNRDGKLELTIGTPNQPTEMWGGEPFNRPTHVAVSPNTGDIYVSDGYGNSRIHKYANTGKYLFSWGEVGIDSGQFIYPHNISVDSEDRVYVADRECHRVQVFDASGNFITMWNNIFRPCGMTLGPDGNIYIGELKSEGIANPPPGLGHRVSIWSPEGEQLARLGHAEIGEEAGRFIAPHAIAVDSNLDIYIGEVTYSIGGGGRFIDPPIERRSLSKMCRVR